MDADREASSTLTLTSHLDEDSHLFPQGSLPTSLPPEQGPLPSAQFALRRRSKNLSLTGGDRSLDVQRIFLAL